MNSSSKMLYKNTENTSSKTELTLGNNLQSEGNISFENNTLIGQQVVQQKLDFFEPDIEKYQSSSGFVSPKITSYLIEILKDKRVLVLGNSPNVDKASFARSLACYLRNESSTSAQKLEVKEWYRNSDPQSIDIELQNTTKSTVFILTQVSPQNIVGYSLSEIQKVAFRSPHYVIVTTDTPFAAWRLSKSAESFWCELTAEDVADSKDLINIHTNEDSLCQWYYQDLDTRERLLALGLSFFDGLFDDQFFAAFEEIVETAWQRRDASLRALDYCDLDKLRSFFNFTETNTSVTFIEVRSPQQRQMLLKIAWKSHRRQILAALPVLVNLVKNSVRRYERELYGSPVRCDLLRRVISETISDIGLIASDAVEDTLLNIAADGDINVQAVAAQAMALWRDSEQRKFIIGDNQENYIDRQLFETLQRWQNGARARSLVDAILNERNQKDSEEPADYIRATIALTAAFAALYDSPDQLSPELLELLKNFIGEENEFVRNRVFTFTLPKLIAQHTIQLRDILHDMLRYFDNSVVAVASSLAFAYRFRPDDVLKTLELWNNECQTTRPAKLDIAEVTWSDVLQATGVLTDPVKIREVLQENVLTYKVTSRDVLQATVALTYGEIECDQSIGSLTAREAVQNLANILSTERHPLVREITLLAISNQAKSAFASVESQLQELVTKVKAKERQKIAEIFADLYLEQRANLSGGEQYIEVNQKQYPVWLNSTRPLTAVEQAMLRWAKNDRNAMAQQVAINASANFAIRFEQEEERQIKQLREGRDSLETTSITLHTDPIEGGKPPQDWYFGKLIPWLATRDAESYRTAIRNLLPEGLRQRQRSSDVMNFVLRKWGNTSDADMNTISKKLKSGFWWAKNLVWLAPLCIGGIGGVLTLVGIAAININNSPSNTPIADTRQPNENNSKTPNTHGFPTNQFDSEIFPKPVCGDPKPTDPQDYPVSFHPVFIDNTDANLTRIKADFCADARPVYREKMKKTSIQVASFTSRQRAEEFRAFLASRFGNAEVGEPRVIPTP